MSCYRSNSNCANITPSNLFLGEETLVILAETKQVEEAKWAANDIKLKKHYVEFLTVLSEADEGM
jgi:hypothetical protein